MIYIISSIWILFSTLFPYLLLMYSFIFKIVCFFISYFVYIFCNSSYFVYIFCNSLMNIMRTFYFVRGTVEIYLYFLFPKIITSIYLYTHTHYFFCFSFLFSLFMPITDASLARSNVSSSARWPEPWPGGAHDGAAANDASCCPVLRPLSWPAAAAAGAGHPQEGEGRYPGAAAPSVHRVHRV